MKHSFRWILWTCLWLQPGAFALDYVTDIMPIFEAKCYDCHSLREGKSKGSLEFDNLEDMEGFYIGPNTTIPPGQPEKSLLLEFVSDADSEDTMPPRGKGERLSSEEIAKVRQWIQEGAAVHPKPGMDKAAPVAERELLTWINDAGKQIEARFLGIEGDHVNLLLANGRKYRYPLANLSAASQKVARELASDP